MNKTGFSLCQQIKAVQKKKKLTCVYMDCSWSSQYENCFHNLEVKLCEVEKVLARNIMYIFKAFHSHFEVDISGVGNRVPHMNNCENNIV